MAQWIYCKIYYFCTWVDPCVLHNSQRQCVIDPTLKLLNAIILPTNASWANKVFYYCISSVIKCTTCLYWWSISLEHIAHAVNILKVVTISCMHDVVKNAETFYDPYYQVHFHIDRSMKDLFVRIPKSPTWVGEIHTMNGRWPCKACYLINH